MISASAAPGSVPLGSVPLGPARLGVGRPALADYPPGARFGPRRMVDFELVWLLAGSARWREPDDGRELLVLPGQMLLIPPDTRDEFHWDPVVPSRHGYVHFQLPAPGRSGPGPTPGAPGSGPTGASVPDPAQWPRLRSILPPGPLHGLLDYLLWLADEPIPDWRARVEEIIGVVVRIFVAGPLPGAAGPPDPPAVAAALEYVRSAWSVRIRPVPLAELATAASVSKAHLARQFKQAYGIGPIAALELVRLARAATLLSRSNLSATEVGRVCGFDDPLYFSRRFRAAYGRSPRAHRSGGGGPDRSGEPPELALALRRLARRLAVSAEPW